MSSDDRGIAERVERVRARIAAAADGVGRDPADVTLVAVRHRQNLSFG